MRTDWDLEVLYKGFDDPAFEADIKAMEEAFAALHQAVEKAPETEQPQRTENLLLSMEKIRTVSGKVGLYASLRTSTNSQDTEAIAALARIGRISSKGSADLSAAKKILGKTENLEELVSLSPVVKEYEVLIKDAEQEAKHLLSDEAESIASVMDLTGGSAWGDLQSFLTSTLKVEYRDKVITLSEVRNLASSLDAEERKDAYFAELKSYEKVQDPVAFALNNIKNQVNAMAEKRGYESPLMQTLEDSKMTRDTLDALIGSMKKYMPVFRKYLKKKGELLGDQNGLKFYNLFAPMGSLDKVYSVEDARDELVKVFSDLTPEMGAMMQEAFDNGWIDFFPKAGKSGGAFCASARSLKQSRILTNFDGTFGAVDTLAHELGHAYHNLMQKDISILNGGSCMQVAETASTFNETYLGAWALKNASTRDERLALLDSDLREKTQTVVDIYSRYLFETAVFEQAKDRFLMAPDLCELMLKAQDESYGDGLDPEYRHPYMWLCKSHYYSSGLSFYNFPYAFGSLFAEGLYALYLKDPEDFLPKYREMLKTTGIHSVEECAQMMGVDLTKPDFWEESLKMIAEEIEEFCSL